MYEKQTLKRGSKTLATLKNSKRSDATPLEARRIQEQSELETLEFIKAIDRYKRRSCKPFPTWSEVLEILKSLGYRKADK
ncbi:MAG: hypothetical protein ACYTG7_11815 [Planctomycetota bacterium]|jgi:hypothetical protein